MLPGPPVGIATSTRRDSFNISDGVHESHISFMVLLFLEHTQMKSDNLTGKEPALCRDGGGGAGRGTSDYSSCFNSYCQYVLALSR